MTKLMGQQEGRIYFDIELPDPYRTDLDAYFKVCIFNYLSASGIGSISPEDDEMITEGVHFLIRSKQVTDPFEINEDGILECLYDTEANTLLWEKMDGQKN